MSNFTIKILREKNWGTNIFFVDMYLHYLHCTFIITLSNFSQFDINFMIEIKSGVINNSQLDLDRNLSSKQKRFCIPESFNTNISHQLFGYTVTFVNQQHQDTNSKGDFVLKNRFKTLTLNISGIQKQIRRFGMTNSINKH